MEQCVVCTWTVTVGERRLFWRMASLWVVAEQPKTVTEVE